VGLEAPAAGRTARAGGCDRQAPGPCGAGCARWPGSCGLFTPSGLQRPACPAALFCAGRVGPGGLRCWFWIQLRFAGTVESVAKSKSKTILVKMVSQAGTGFSFNTKRSRLREKLTLLHYDPVVRKKVLFVEQKKIRSL
uniref:Large ribosomal subunit protein bL33m n=1 Tax=Equus caballus TaxID=9796 RepID=A0A9L0RX38_HORSE